MEFDDFAKVMSYVLTFLIVIFFLLILLFGIYRVGLYFVDLF